jgi:hypothetical protein
MQYESACVTRLELFCEDEWIGTGTAFLYRYATTVALVTNWHNLSGVDYVRKFIPRKLPTRIRFHVSIKHDIGTTEFRGVEMELRRGGQAVWRQNVPGGVGVIDVAMIVFDEANASHAGVSDVVAKIMCIQGGQMVYIDDGKSEYATPAYPYVGDDVFIVGFPHGLTKQGAVPVWKRGSIATEPLLGIENNGLLYLVDSLTRKGMSGSPVIFFGGRVQTEDGRRVEYPSRICVGVYAGREGSTDEEMSIALSRVWKTEAIEMLFYNDSWREGSPYLDCW